MHLDTLAGLKEVKICTAYSFPISDLQLPIENRKFFKWFPTNADKLSQAQPFYETLPGWDEDITGVTDFRKLPANAQNYIFQIEKIIGKPVTIIGVGPKRSQTIFR